MLTLRNWSLGPHSTMSKILPQSKQSRAPQHEKKNAPTISKESLGLHSTRSSHIQQRKSRTFIARKHFQLLHNREKRKNLRKEKSVGLNIERYSHEWKDYISEQGVFCGQKLCVGVVDYSDTVQEQSLTVRTLCPKSSQRLFADADIRLVYLSEDYLTRETASLNIDSVKQGIWRINFFFLND